ncbi:MAG: hypothetical protein ACT4OV_07955 [Microthrixaceae bacterium]
MNYRKTVIAVVAGASLLGTFGVASATHRDPGYSPCRPGEDDLRVGYEDVKEREDPRHELPTIYANGAPESGDPEGNIGICGGSTEKGTAQYVEVGNNADGPYVASDPAAPVPADATAVPADATEVPVGEEGSVNVGDDYVEVDGTKDNQPSEVHPWLDGYVSAGLEEHNGGPGVCMGGDGNHELFEDPNSASWKDCNDELLAGDPTEAIPD